MVLKAIYIDGWMPTRNHEKGRKKYDFIQQVLTYEDKNKWNGFSDFEKATCAVHAVFKTLKKYISEGEMEDIISVLPHQLKDLLRESIYQRKITIKRVYEKA